MLQRLILAGAICVVGGCVELGNVLQDGAGGRPGAISPLDGDNDTERPDDGAPTSEFTVRLNVSNPAPQEYEQVFLTCQVVSGEPAGVSFAFESSAGRLTVDSARGRASFVVDASDLNTELSFMCTAADAGGISAASNRIVIIPTG